MSSRGSASPDAEEDDMLFSYPSQSIPLRKSALEAMIGSDREASGDFPDLSALTYAAEHMFFPPRISQVEDSEYAGNRRENEIHLLSFVLKAMTEFHSSGVLPVERTQHVVGMLASMADLHHAASASALGLRKKKLYHALSVMQDHGNFVTPHPSIDTMSFVYFADPQVTFGLCAMIP